MPGPIPKREEERRRRNKDVVETTKVNLDELLAQEVEVPLANEDWEPLTKSYWESFQRSGQSIWYEPSDWMTAYALMEVLDRWLKPQQIRIGEIRPGQNEGGEVTYLFEDKIVAMPGGVLSSILKGLASLMATEGDRRRLRIELERKKALDAALSGDGKVVSIAKSREEAMAAARRAVKNQTG